MNTISTTITRALLVATSLAAFLVPATVAQADQAPKTKRVSVRSNGHEVNVDNDYGSVSGNGRYVSFESPGKFTAGDDGFDADVFVHDRITGKTRRASLKSNGTEAKAHDCEDSSISASGNLVAFTCDGALVPSDANNYADIYVKKMSSGKIVRASVKSDGSEIPTSSFRPSISADGRYVAFVSDGALVDSDTNGNKDIYRHDLKTGKTVRISIRSDGDQTSDDSFDPSISGDGNRVAFASWDGSLTSEPDYQNVIDRDIFVRDVKAKTTTRASLKSDGTEADPNKNQDNEMPAISANGRFVAFGADYYGTYVADDMNGENDVYVHDLKTGKTSRVSVTSSVDELNTVGGSGADAPASISGNGRYVAFESYAPLVSGDSNDVRDIYVHDRKTQKTRRVSLRSNGEEVGTYGHQLPSISKDGRWIAFSSLGEFTGGDSGVDFDVFERGPLH